MAPKWRFDRKLCPLPGKIRDLRSDIAAKRFGSSLAEEGFGRAGSRDGAVLEEHHLVGDLPRILWLVGHEKHGHAPLGLHAGQKFQHVPAQGRAERAERLVEEKHGPVADQDARNRHPLPLAAGEFTRQAMVLPGKAGAIDVQGLPRNELADLITQMNEQMLAAARELQFEVAARLRDELAELKKELRQLDAAHA